MNVAILTMLGIIIVLIARCAPPPISELIKAGVNCKATITMPDTRAGETVDVKVKIYDCQEVK